MTDTISPVMLMNLPSFETSHWSSLQTMDANAEYGDSVSWSDIPCQGDYYLIDFQELQCAPELIQHTLKSSSQEHIQHKTNDCKYPVSPPSPRSLSEELLCQWNCITTKSRSALNVKKTVRFSEVTEIRTYEVILGDHPSCRGGMALQLGWSHDGTELVNFEIFENASRHRTMAELHLSFFHRRERLRHLTGMSGCELLRAEYEMVCDNGSSSISAPTVLRRSNHSL